MYDIRKISPLNGEGAIALIKRAQVQYIPQIGIGGNSLETAIVLFNYMNDKNKKHDVDSIPLLEPEKRVIAEGPQAKVLKHDPFYIRGYNIPVLTGFKSLEEAIGDHSRK